VAEVQCVETGDHEKTVANGVEVVERNEAVLAQFEIEDFMRRLNSPAHHAMTGWVPWLSPVPFRGAGLARKDHPSTALAL
jgi:hypothetical protein